MSRVQPGGTLTGRDLARHGPVRKRPRLQVLLGNMAGRRGDSVAGRMQTGQQAGASWRTPRTDGVRPRESHSAFGQPLDVRRLVKPGRAVERGVTPAEVIGEDDDDVRLLCSTVIAANEHEECEEGAQKFYGWARFMVGLSADAK